MILFLIILNCITILHRKLTVTYYDIYMQLRCHKTLNKKKTNIKN